jgi:hypothetical protein
MADEVAQALEAVADPETLSFYGLSHYLGEITKLLSRADDVLLAKAPRAEDKALAERKDDLIDASSRLRRAMGSRLEGEPLSKRERPLAEEFLRQQISKLQKSATGATAEKATRAVDKMRQIMEDLRKKPVALETKEVQEIEASLKTAEADWKEVSPIYDKWDKGRHTFKTNAELQAMKKKYENCKKIRENAPERLHKALCSTREGKTLAVAEKEGLPKGWLSAAKKAPTSSTGAARPKAVRRSAPAPNAWGSAAISFAQRLRAQVSQQVREEAAGPEGDDEVEAEDYDEDAPEFESNATAPEVKAHQAPVRPKAPPSLPRNADADGFTAVKPSSASRPPAPAPKRAPQNDDEEDEEEDDGDNRKSSAYSASAKKKGKGKKKKGGLRDEDDVAEAAPAVVTARPSAAAWTATAEAAISGSVLQDLFRSTSWSLPEDEACADAQLGNLTERLAWVTPLGLVLPLEWKEFISLEVDGGPRRTSRRGTPEWVTRAQKNAAAFLGHYITIVFALTLLHALSHFGLLLWAYAVQVGLILMPSDSPYLRSPQRVLLLQGAHLVLWLLFVRSLWQMHFFVKCLNVLLVAGHAYIVAPLGES